MSGRRGGGVLAGTGRAAMLTFIRRRLISSVVTLIGVVIVVFFLARLTGSPADLFFPEGASQERIEAFNRAYGLDKPLVQQFGIFLLKAAHGDFGDSIWQQRPAMAAAWGEMPMTLLLAVVAMSFSVTVALVLGSLAATHRFRFLDRLVTFASLITGSI